MKFTILFVLFVTLLAVPASAVDFVLMGSDNMHIMSSYATGTLWDYSVATIHSGGSVVRSYLYDFTTLNLADGSALEIRAYYQSTVNVIGGSSLLLEVNDSARAYVLGGYFSGTSAIQMRGNSSLTFSGGTVESDMRTYGTSSSLISGGSVRSLYTQENSSMRISGGTLPYLYVYDSSNVKIYGTDFRLGSGLSIVGNKLVGTGMLTGRWTDDTPWATSVVVNRLTASIELIPEPSGMFILFSCITTLGILRRR